MSWYDSLNEQTIRQLFAARDSIEWRPEPIEDVYFTEREKAEAAVLIPLIKRPTGLTVMLTQRTKHLSAHAGQISFPGGRCEETDLDFIDTALRETEEETGLSRHFVEVLAPMPRYLTATNFWVTPVVALVEPQFELKPDEFEVEEIFEAPLSFLMNESNHQKQTVQTPKGERSFYAVPWTPQDADKSYFIWGATATMLRNLHHFLAAGMK